MKYKVGDVLYDVSHWNTEDLLDIDDVETQHPIIRAVVIKEVLKDGYMLRGLYSPLDREGYYGTNEDLAKTLIELETKLDARINKALYEQRLLLIQSKKIGLMKANNKEYFRYSLLTPEMVKVIVNGVEKEIKLEDAKKWGLV